MEVTEVRVKLMDDPGDRLKAFCSVTFDDCFVIRDLKIIEGSTGPFVAMPSRKLTSHCRKCGAKNHLRAYYCNQCGARQEEGRAPKDADGRAKLYADIAHPINSVCREMIQDCVIREFYEELERAKQPGYISRYDDYDFDYADPVPTRPARVDQPHGEPSPAHSHAPQFNRDGEAAGGQNAHHFHSHDRQNLDRQNNDRHDSKTAEPLERPSAPNSGGFGAGILPGS